MRTWPLIVFAMLAMSGCQTRTPAFLDRMEAAGDARDLAAKAYAEKRTSEAKGEKTCYVTQVISAYKAKQRIADRDAHSYSTKSITSNTIIVVQRDGSAYISVVEDKYPGSTQYFLIGGRRISAPEDRGVHLDKDALAAIGRGEAIKYTWTDWPYRSETDSEDAYQGFQEAYEDCLAFLK